MSRRRRGANQSRLVVEGDETITMLVDDDRGANRSRLLVRQGELQVHTVRREVRADKRTVVLITEPTYECARAPSRRQLPVPLRCSHQAALTRPDAALVVCLEAST